MIACVKAGWLAFVALVASECLPLPVAGTVPQTAIASQQHSYFDPARSFRSFLEP